MKYDTMIVRVEYSQEGKSITEILEKEFLLYLDRTVASSNTQVVPCKR